MCPLAQATARCGLLDDDHLPRRRSPCGLRDGCGSRGRRRSSGAPRAQAAGRLTGLAGLASLGTARAFLLETSAPLESSLQAEPLYGYGYGGQAWQSIKAYYVNVEGSESRRACSEHQLSLLQAQAVRVGWRFEFERFPAVTFKNCTTTSECIEERPECFPVGTAGFIHHGLQDDAGATAAMVRGVLGNWCSHLRLLERMAKDKHRHHAYLLLEDDFIITEDFGPSLHDFLKNMPHFWNLVALDTFSGGGRVPVNDAFGIAEFGPTRLRSLSATMNSYWGAHAWLVHAHYLQRFISFYRSTPAIPLDWVTKADHPMHMGIWAYDTGALRQRQHASRLDMSRHPVFCQNMTVSDLLGGGIPVEGMQPAEARAGAEAGHRSSEGPPSAPEQQLATAWAPAMAMREVHVLGMHGSGVQFARELIRSNLAKPGSEALRLSDEIWPHTHPQRIPTGDQVLTGSVAVVVVRHPFPSIRSLQRRQEKLGMSCMDTGLSGSAGIDGRCIFPNSTQEDLACPEGRGNGTCWSSLPEAWNSYVNTYEKLRTAGVFRKVLLLRYEDIVEDPRLALMQVGIAAGMHPGAINDEISEALFWNVNGEQAHREALVKLGRRMYDSNLTCPEMHALCSRVNRDLLYAHGYHGCQAKWPGFSQLIYNGTQFQEHPQIVQMVFAQEERLDCDDA